MTSAAFTDAFLSFSGAPFFVLVNMSTSYFRRYEGTMRESADCSTRHQRYHVLSAATLSNGGNRNFVHMKVMVGAGVSCIRGSRKPFAVAVSSRTLFKGSALKMRIPPIVPTKRNRRWMATGNGTASSALAPSKRWGQRAPAPASAYRKSSRCFMMPRAKFITNTSHLLPTDG
jgi:hypothetical protein